MLSIMLLAFLAAAVLVSLPTTNKLTNAANDYTITRVTHSLQILHNGYIFLNDTFELSTSGQGPTEFFVGFPNQYAFSVKKAIAYSSAGSYNVALDVPLGERLGFFGARIDFPNGAPSTFSSVFVLSNDLLTATDATDITLDFPAFPSLTKPAELCNVTITPPLGATFTGGTVNSTLYSQPNLPEFTFMPANASFTISAGQVQIVDVAALTRQISVDEFGGLHGMDSYEISNRQNSQVTTFEVALPMNVSNIKAQDPLGRPLTAPTLTDSTNGRYQVTFSEPVDPGRASSFLITYDLPSAYRTTAGETNLLTNSSSFQNLNIYADQASVTFVLPEGANVLSVMDSSSAELLSVTKQVFQETVSVTRMGLTSLESFSPGLSYSYSPLWLAFRPTLLMWSMAVVVGIFVAIILRRPKAPAAKMYVSAGGVVKLSPESTRSFVDAFEEKMKIRTEIESLESRVEKGRIPRRRYKVRKRMLEARLDTLNRTIEENQSRMQAAGGKYSDLMRQLEIAEAQIDQATTNAKSIEDRHSRGELSLEAYRKMSTDNQKTRENAETAINGILLRLREEVR